MEKDTSSPSKGKTKKINPPLTGFSVVAIFWIWAALLFYMPIYLDFTGIWLSLIVCVERLIGDDTVLLSMAYSRWAYTKEEKFDTGQRGVPRLLRCV